MVLSFSIVRSFVMRTPAAEKAISTSAGVAAIVFKASPSFIIFDVQFSVESNNCNSCFPILLKLELLLVEQLKAFVFEWIGFSNFSCNVKGFSSKVSGLSSECEELDSDLPSSQKRLVIIILDG
ncbi:hypothetical protein AVEN_57210-1 [Araneus ventricosus]|uniref:Uncharacterized protein n=1 Tax=Araneus ventricosus TaxID=182803 RepID=A0A4Y2L0Q7_ARAVE|nr:hypothetical protein AVEN_57210-1 [Araneus ventricosus]